MTLLVALPAAIAAAAVLGRSRCVVIASVQAMSALSVVVPANANADCLGRASDYGWPVSLTLLVYLPAAIAAAVVLDLSRYVVAVSVQV